jgi:hypothetical protein
MTRRLEVSGGRMSIDTPRRFAAAIALAFLSYLATGCGLSHRFDATSEETVKASIEAMCAGKSEDQRKQLADDLATFTPTRPDASLTGAKKSRAKPAAASSTDPPNGLYKPLHGLTADEIHDKAETTRRVRKSRSPM